MSNKTSDYDLGCRVAGLLVSGACAPAQLMAVLGDLAENDVQLSSAFRMLGSHPVFVDSLTPALPLEAARVAALRGLANETLSPFLADRIHQFLAGFSSYLEPVSGGISIASNVSLPDESESELGVSTEPATLFASPDDSSTEPRRPPGASLSPVTTKPSSLDLPIKPLLLLGSIVVIVVSLFKVKPLCEPLALCAKKDEAPAAVSPEPVPDQPKQNQPRVEPSSPPTPQALPSPPSTPMTPAPVPSPPRSPDGPALRDEPLW